ncbi:MAG: tetratricopeptide repeat protein [Saprospiraceae bacterium]|nr:tetratricopeptide repeat protein [Saprospiraceae bacterium]
MENTNLSLQEKIQAFVAGELDDASRQALLQQAQADPDIADEIAFSQSLARALRYPDAVAASATIAAVMAEEGFPPPPPPAPTFSLRKTVWKWLGGGAALLILALGGYLVAERATASATTSQQLSRTALEPLENVFSLPSNAEQLPDLQRAMTAYDAGRHAEAIRAFEAYLAKRPDSAARLYLGVSYLLSGQADKAIQPLSLASLSEEPPLKEAAFWYLALAYLERNNTLAARQALSEMPLDGIYHTKAKALLDALPDN